MNAYKNMLVSFQKADYNTLLSTARTAAQSLRNHCRNHALPCQAEELISAVLLSGVGADGKLSSKEKQFVAEVLQIEPKKVTALIAAYSEDFVTYVDHVADNGTAETKGAILTLIAALAAVDQNISAGENELIRKILK
ncbi:MAG: TerB family tellurite resistance protein [Clostridia bacterium]|nr:TerB family tellurite resistance protein [Clostridia bacterium]